MKKLKKIDLAQIGAGSLVPGKYRVSSKHHGVHSPVVKKLKSGGYSVIGHKTDLTIDDIDVAAAAMKQDLGLTTAGTTDTVSI